MTVTPSGEVVDVHAHYLPQDALDLLGRGRAAMSTMSWCGVDDHLALNGMPVGATLPMLTSVDSMLAAMDATGVDRRILSPPPFTYRYWDEPADGLALCQLLNDTLTAVVEKHPDRFTALGTVPLQAPDLAVAELTRVVSELGLAGLTLGTNVDGGHLSDPGPRDVLAAATGHGAAVLVHPDFVPNERWRDHYLVNLIGLPTETALCLSNLVLSGTLADLPELRICFVHGGGSLPYLLGRVDRGWRVRPETGPDIADVPTSYLDNVFFDTLTHDARGLRFLLDTVGADHVVIGTDAPFDVEDPNPLAHVGACPGLTADERERITRGNAPRWLRGTAVERGSAQ